MAANLAKTSNLPWVVEQCLTRTAPTFVSQAALLEHGLQLSATQAQGDISAHMQSRGQLLHACKARGAVLSCSCPSPAASTGCLWHRSMGGRGVG